MEVEADLLEPVEGLDIFNVDPSFYVEVERHKLQEALRLLYEKICELEEGAIRTLEDYLREKGFEDKVISDAFEIMKLPTENIAYAQCWVDSLEEARNEKQFVKDAGGVIYYDAIIESIAKSSYVKYSVSMKSKRFKNRNNADGIRIFTFDFTEKIRQKLKKEFNIH